MNQELINKVKKLLALSDSPNEHEAESAMRKAKELISRYALNITEDPQETIVEVPYYTKLTNKGLKNELPKIVDIISNYFNSSTLIRTRLPEFEHIPHIIGFNTTVQIIQHALDCIIAQIDYDYRKEYAKNPSLGLSYGFWKGAVEGLRNRYSKDSSETGIILYNKTKEYISEKYPTLRYLALNSVSDTGRAQGISSGQSASIRAGINSVLKGNLLS